MSYRLRGVSGEKIRALGWLGGLAAGGSRGQPLQSMAGPKLRKLGASDRGQTAALSVRAGLGLTVGSVRPVRHVIKRCRFTTVRAKPVQRLSRFGSVHAIMVSVRIGSV